MTAGDVRVGVVDFCPAVPTRSPGHPATSRLYCAVADQCFPERDRIGGPVGDVLDAVSPATTRCVVKTPVVSGSHCIICRRAHGGQVVVVLADVHWTVAGGRRGRATYRRRGR